ncbi:Protein O-linked-mannose beta-1-4-N-acetylglucosaminyltransferase 2 [Nymphaea thermarum]|nr:Protein O-linked-mannose beta-1-4-N-acetylglucosaminyltransferase 2 [Nymphaea thermarum]
MFQHHRSHGQRKGQEALNECQTFVECGNMYRRTRPRLLRLFLVFSVVSCILLFSPRLFAAFTNLPLFYVEDTFLAETENRNPSCPSILKNGTFCCDRSSFRTDVCYMKGDIRTISSTNSIFLYTSFLNTTEQKQEEETIKIKPYTRKWETSIMNTIDELTLVKTSSSPYHHHCDVHHSVPAIFFSTGGYTGNVYHEFNDGIIPLYITSQKYKKEVVFVILEYHSWWITKYSNILSLLSNYAPIDFANSKQRHCFSEAIVGLNIHDELTVNSSMMRDDPKSMLDFRRLLDDAYRPRIRGLLGEEGRKEDENERGQRLISNPKLVIISRNGSRAILNQESLVKVAEEIGFKVEVLSPTRTTELAKIYRSLNSSDVMVGVHGAAMTHFMFMRPGTVFIQVVPLGTDWAAQTYYGDPAMKLGLRYINYKILPRESSLYAQYDKDDPVLTDPQSLNKKGWEVTKRLYLDGQNVTLEMKRFRKRLLRAYIYSVSRRRKEMMGRSVSL